MSKTITSQAEPIHGISHDFLKQVHEKICKMTAEEKEAFTFGAEMMLEAEQNSSPEYLIQGKYLKFIKGSRDYRIGCLGSI